MKILTKITMLAAVAIMTLLMSCKESDDQAQPELRAINVVNAIADVANMKVNLSGGPVLWSRIPEQVANGMGKLYYAPSATVDFESIDVMDTTKTLMAARLNLRSKIYSLYLSGSAGQVDTMLREEVDFPFIHTDVGRPAKADSVIHVRFVNLSKGSPELKVTLSTTPTVNEVASLNYQGVTAWKKYVAGPKDPTSYTFQFRRTSDNTVLASRAVSISATNRFKNMAIVVKGVIGGTGTNAFAANIVNYY